MLFRKEEEALQEKLRIEEEKERVKKEKIRLQRAQSAENHERTHHQDNQRSHSAAFTVNMNSTTSPSHQR